MKTKLTMVGWREWIALPQFNIPGIKAKVDTGAKTSALHAYFVEPYKQDGEQWVRFGMHPEQNSVEHCVECCAPVVDQRVVTDSGGHREERYVICATLGVGDNEFAAELTLTNRDTMRFRMLLGRNALNGRFCVDPASSFLLGKSRAGNSSNEKEDEDSDFIEE